MQTSNTNTSSGREVSSATSAAHHSATTTSRTTPVSGGVVISSGGTSDTRDTTGTNNDGDGPARPIEVHLANSQRATLPLIFRDHDGNAITAPRVQGSVSSDDPAVARAEIAHAGAAIIIHPFSDGQCVITYANGGLTTSVAVTVETPVPTSVEFAPADLHDKSAS